MPYEPAVLACKVFVSLVGISLTVVGFGGLPDDLKRWSEWMAKMRAFVVRHHLNWLIVSAGVALVVISWLPWRHWLGETTVAVAADNGVPATSSTNEPISAEDFNTLPTDDLQKEKKSLSDQVASQKATIQSLQQKIEGLQNELNRLTTEQSMKIRQVTEDREQAEQDYALVARFILDEHQEKSRQWKAVTVSIKTLEKYKEMHIGSQAAYQSWHRRLQHLYSCLGILDEQYGVTVQIPDHLPSSWELKQFASFSQEHNRLLNLIDHQIGELEKMLPVAEQKQ